MLDNTVSKKKTHTQSCNNAGSFCLVLCQTWRRQLLLCSKQQSQETITRCFGTFQCKSPETRYLEQVPGESKSSVPNLAISSILVNKVLPHWYHLRRNNCYSILRSLKLI